jgi:hypothetical protein
MNRLVTASLFASLAACYQTPAPECAFACSATSSACPADYTCRPDGLCKRTGVPDDFTCPGDDPAVDAPVIDTPNPIDATDAPEIDAVDAMEEIDAPDIDAPEIDAPVDAAIDAAVDAFAGLRITTASPVAFGTVTVGNMPSMVVTVTNDGAMTTTALTVTVMQTGVGTEFTLLGTGNTCTGQTLDEDETCMFSVEFAPTDAGAEAGTAMVSAATGGNSAINLTGTGQ